MNFPFCHFAITNGGSCKFLSFLVNDFFWVNYLFQMNLPQAHVNVIINLTQIINVLVHWNYLEVQWLAFTWVSKWKSLPKRDVTPFLIIMNWPLPPCNIRYILLFYTACIRMCEKPKPSMPICSSWVCGYADYDAYCNTRYCQCFHLVTICKFHDLLYQYFNQEITEAAFDQIRFCIKLKDLRRWRYSQFMQTKVVVVVSWHF